MKKILSILVLFILNSGLSVYAGLVLCEFDDLNYKIKAFFDENYETRGSDPGNTGTQTVKIEVFFTDRNTTKITNYSHVSHFWDGSLSGMLNAPGLALRYENENQRFRNVTLLTFIGPTYLEEKIQRFTTNRCRVF